MQKYIYNGIDLCNKAWYVEEVLDGIGSPGFRGENIQVPFQNGSRHIKKRYKSKPFILGMWVSGRDKTTGLIPAGKTELEQLYENIDYLCMIFGRAGQYDLVRVMPDGGRRVAKAEVYGKVDYAVKPENYCKFTVEFQLADPFFYSEDPVVDENTINSTTYTIQHPYDGTAEVTKCRITLTGPLQNPKILNKNNGIWLQYWGLLQTGEVVDINTEDYSCMFGSVSHIAALKHGGDAYWLVIEPGTNAIEITTQVAGGKVDFEYYQAYF